MPPAILESKYKGKKYGRLTVISKTNIKTSTGGEYLWKFKCDCGKIVTTRLGAIITGAVISCGCRKKEYTGAITHGLSKNERLYFTWKLINQRCHGNASNNKNYKDRGISIFIDWKNDYLAFKKYVTALPNFPKDLLEPPKSGKRTNFSIDRIDNNGSYEPGNLKWSTSSEQARNRRNNRYVTYKGKERVLAELCEAESVDYKTVHRRLSRGWSIERAING